VRWWFVGKGERIWRSVEVKTSQRTKKGKKEWPGMNALVMIPRWRCTEAERLSKEDEKRPLLLFN
jgi:hypothetical protein